MLYKAIYSRFVLFLSEAISMMAFFCHHVSDNKVYLSDLYISLSDTFFDLSAKKSSQLVA